MLTGSNKERLEQEIANLITFIAEGRDFFFKKTGYSVNSSDEFVNHFVSKELFHANPELTQLELNIQLLYIKLASYYQLVAFKEVNSVKRPRMAFAHELTDLIFNKRVKYNFFLHKVTENFKRVQLIFYEEIEDETFADGTKPLVKTMDLELDSDINNFLAVWSGSK